MPARFVAPDTSQLSGWLNESQFANLLQYKSTREGTRNARAHSRTGSEQNSHAKHVCDARYIPLPDWHVERAGAVEQSDHVGDRRSIPCRQGLVELRCVLKLPKARKKATRRYQRTSEPVSSRSEMAVGRRGVQRGAHVRLSQVRHVCLARGT